MDSLAVEATKEIGWWVVVSGGIAGVTVWNYFSRKAMSEKLDKVEASMAQISETQKEIATTLAAMQQSFHDHMSVDAQTNNALLTFLQTQGK